MGEVKFALDCFLLRACWLLGPVVLETIRNATMTILYAKSSSICQSRISIELDGAPTSRTLCPWHHPSHDALAVRVIVNSLAHLPSSSDKIIWVDLVDNFVILIRVISWSSPCMRNWDFAHNIWARSWRRPRLLILKVHLNMRYLRWRSISTDIRLASHRKILNLNYL